MRLPIVTLSFDQGGVLERVAAAFARDPRADVACGHGCIEDLRYGCRYRVNASPPPVRPVQPQPGGDGGP